MILISEEYDHIFSALEGGANVAIIPVRDGCFQSVYAPATWDAMRKMKRNPNGFALLACKKTRDYARAKGYEVIE